jgi:hypothetical protein
MFEACCFFPLYQMMSSTFHTDDIKLVAAFVEGSNQLLTSDRARLEVTGIISQIITKTGEVAATMYLQSKPRTAVIKTDLEYTSKIEECLLTQNFVLMGNSKKAGYLEYHQYDTPVGYKIWYTEPTLLWKKWWPTERFQNKRRFNMNMLVQIKDKWYPVQNIVIDAGIFVIKTLVGQIRISSHEQLLWLSQIPVEDIAVVSGNDDAWSRSPEVWKESSKQELPKIAITSANEINVPAPPAAQAQIRELERKLYKQQQATIVAEQRAMSAEQQLALLKKQLLKKELEAN